MRVYAPPWRSGSNTTWARNRLAVGRFVTFSSSSCPFFVNPSGFSRFRRFFQSQLRRSALSWIDRNLRMRGLSAFPLSMSLLEVFVVGSMTIRCPPTASMPEGCTRHATAPVVRFLRSLAKAKTASPTRR